jgi:hypothetical protein
MNKKSHNSGNKERREIRPLRKTNIAEAVTTYINPPTPDPTWEDLESVYLACAKALVVFANEINGIVSNPVFIDNFVKKDELEIIVTGTKRDIDIFADELMGLHNMHQGKMGKITDEQELVLSLNIFDDYVNFNNRFSAVSGPIMQRIMSIVTETSLEMQAKKIADDLEALPETEAVVIEEQKDGK